MTPTEHRGEADTEQHADPTLSPSTVLGLTLDRFVALIVAVVVAVGSTAIAYANLRATDAELQGKVERCEKRMGDLATKADLESLGLRLRLCIRDPLSCER